MTQKVKPCWYRELKLTADERQQDAMMKYLRYGIIEDLRHIRCRLFFHRLCPQR